jgi:pimeloyl-ACP methyl ester carboxylesterase
MPYVENGGVRIHYELEGDGPPLILQHGFTSSLQNWYAHGYVEGLQSAYRLVLIDARGHGLSDKPHDSAAYDLKLRVGDVTAVLDELDIARCHYLGYSMGGRIGFGIARYASERVYSLIIGGMHPYNSGGNVPLQERTRLLEQGMEAYVANTESQSGPIDPDRRARLLANDPKALLAAITAPRGPSNMEDVCRPCKCHACYTSAKRTDSSLGWRRAPTTSQRSSSCHFPVSTMAKHPGRAMWCSLM